MSSLMSMLMSMSMAMRLKTLVTIYDNVVVVVVFGSF